MFWNYALIIPLLFYYLFPDHHIILTNFCTQILTTSMTNPSFTTRSRSVYDNSVMFRILVASNPKYVFTCQLVSQITGFTVMSVHESWWIGQSKFNQLSRFILHQLGFGDTVSRNQVLGSMLKGIRWQSSTNLVISKPWNYLSLVCYGTCLSYLSIIKWTLFLFPQKYNKFEHYFQFV